MTSKRKKVTMAEIAAAASVSKATVSRALAGSHLIGKEVREEIEAVARSLGYVRRPVRRHGERCILTVKLVLPPVKSRTARLFFSLTDLVMGLREGLSPAGVNVLVEIGGENYQPFPHKKGGEVEVFVFAFHRPTEEVQEQIQERGARVVVLNRELDGVQQVLHHHEQAMGLIAGHLADRNAEGRSCFVTYAGIEEVSASRLKGFADAAARLGLDFDRERDLWLLEKPEEMTSEDIRARIQGGVQNFVGVNDVAGALLLQHTREIGLRVPEEVRITGCDNAEVRGVTVPLLTTVDLSMNALALEAGRAMYAELIDGEEARERKLVSGELLVGETT